MTLDEAPEVVLGGGLLEIFSGFIEELRAVGVPVSTLEVLDATDALRHLPLEDREALKQGLAAALVKDGGHWRTFETLFEVYFALQGFGSRMALPGAEGSADVPADGQLTVSELSDLALRALMDGDETLFAALARAAVDRYAGIEPGRPVGASYYVFRALRQLKAGSLVEQLLADGGPADGLEGLVQEAEYRRRLEQLRAAVASEVNRRLVADRGAKEVARTLRRPLPEDVDFMHLGRDELAALQRTVQPLARKLAVHLARKRRLRTEGRLDFRATMRRSLSSGGVPADPRFKARHRSKPELWVLADISGSVAAFARFTLQLVYELSSQFSRARSWAFIDGIDEVTDLLRGASDVSQAVHSINTQADVIWTEGHSDYGHALCDLVERWARDLGPRTTVLVLGDARNNYHPPQAWAVGELAHRARQVFWLNPEPRAYWDTGDSVLAQYGAHCSGVYECRNLRQLRRFIEQLP